MTPHMCVRVLLIGLASGALAAASACSSSGKSDLRSERVATPVVRDVPAIFRGTIGAETTLRGAESRLIAGFGFVVGLNGTGTGALRPDVEETVRRDLARRGLGIGGQVTRGPFANRTVTDIIRDPDTAVVIVEAAVPPGAPKGYRFDLNVRPLPASGATRLEDGLLWSTDLRLGAARPMGTVNTRTIGKGEGQVFVNPFAAPGDRPSAPNTVAGGRVLNGGTVTNPAPIQLILDNPSAQRARSITAAINTAFPADGEDRVSTARGRNDEVIDIRMPSRYADDPESFLNLLRATRIDSSFPEEWAKRYTEELRAQPAMADELAWMLEALGEPAIPFLADMYEYAEAAPRLAALRAGARLGDPRTSRPLIEMARTAPPALRVAAIRLLGELPFDPSIAMALRPLRDDAALDVRVAAYEALRGMGDPIISSRAIGAGVGGSKFVLDVVPSASPLVYVKQSGFPRIVLFGEDLEVNERALVSAWENGLILVADENGDAPRIRYRPPTGRRAVETSAPKNVQRLIAFLAQTPLPENPNPGLNLTYAQTVGALYEFHKQGAIDMAFATEQDKLNAELLAALRTTMLSDRPETRADAERRDDPVWFEPIGADGAGTGEDRDAGAEESWVVPIKRESDPPSSDG